MIETSNNPTAHARMDYAESILCSIPLGLIALTDDLRVYSANSATDKLLGKPHHSLLGAALDQVLPDQDLRECIQQAIATGKSQYAIAMELPGATCSEVSLVPIFHTIQTDALTRITVRLLMILEDISLSRPCPPSSGSCPTRSAPMDLMSDDLRAMSKLSSAIQQTADSVVITDSEGTIEYVNQAFERLTGYPRAQAVGMRPSLMKSGRHSEVFYKRLWHTIRNGRVFSSVFVNQTKDGHLYYEDKTITPLRDARGHITHFVSTGKDVTERMKAEQHLDHLAHHDALTDLPNRTLFLDRFKQALVRATRNDLQVAVLFLDLDSFKQVNDSLGHDAGDLLLQAVARRLSDHIRAVDSLARFGGDEFALLLEDVAGVQALPAIAQDILDTFKEPFKLDGSELHITTSIGISLYPEDGCDPQVLLKNADTAMYQAKAQGKNKYCFYTADMNAKASERQTLENALRHALERKEFVLYYQPQLAIGTGCIIGIEALLRWRHPDHGLMSPDEFVPLLEEMGLMLDVGEWVIQEALTQTRAWRQLGYEALRLSINLSPVQIRDAGFVTRIERRLRHEDYAQDAHLLNFEITEALLHDILPDTLEKLQALRAFGTRLSLDNFGTGYSSLVYLTRFPFDTVKLDRSLVGAINTDSHNTAMIDAIIAMTQSLKLNVIAEGVETEVQLNYLRGQGCDVMQGKLFSAALPAERLTALLRISQDRPS